jgi:hypothetical protein
MSAHEHKPFRVRTVTAFLQLPPDSSRWEAEVAAAGKFLAFAQQQLEALGKLDLHKATRQII